MSVASKLKGLTAGLGEALDQKTGRSDPPVSQAAPLQLMALRTEMNGYEDKIAALEAKVKDLETSAVSVANISPNPWQPRKVFNEDDIRNLAESISEVGLIQPVIVRSVGNPNTFGHQDLSSKSVGNPNTFQLVSGERRWRAHQLLSMTEIKAIVVEVSDQEMAMMALAENIARKDLTAYEISKAVRAVQTQFKTTKRLAESVGINRTELYKYLAFADLPDFVIADLEVSPGILGRDAAMDIMSTMKKHGQAAIDVIERLWPQVKSGHLDQTKLASTIDASILRGTTTRTDRDIKKLFVGKEQAGSITKDATSLTIKIKSAALSLEQERSLREFVEGLLKV